MFATNLESKLKKINSKFWIDWEHKIITISKDGSAGLYLDDDYICGCSLGNIPGESIKEDSGRIIIRGWKDLLKILFDFKLVTSNDVLKYFGWDGVKEWK